ncbi:MAG: energy transducer TonB [Steroidobacteraceae bacterium]
MRSRTLLWLVLLLPLGMPAHAQTPAKRALPSLSADLNTLSYPSGALRAGLQGRVLVAFTITKKGRADDVEVVTADPAGEFDATAIKAVKQVRFTVPEDWEASGASAYRFQLSVLFKLNPCVAPACIAPQMHEAADDFLVVGAQAK